MRIVSGSAGGLHLETIADDDNIRPTTDKVKESVFNILQFEIKGRRFIDLFGGTGQIGIEAASRGAEEVIIVDNNKKALNVIKKNVLKLKNKFNIRIVNSNSINFLKTTVEKSDVAFLDPPYGSKLLDMSSRYIDRIMNEDGTIVTETSVDTRFNENMGKFKKVKEYIYGKILISYYKING